MDSVTEVLRILDREVRRNLPAEHPAGRVAVGDALGRILAEGVEMSSDSPPFDRALLDGFAVRSADAVLGARLRIIGKQDAGPGIFEGELGPGQCVAINTGGAFPQGADGVLMVEHSRVTTAAGREEAEVLQPVPPGYGVQRRGSDARKGELALWAGMRLGPAQLAAAVAAGAAELAVRPRAKVAVLTTGDELARPGEPLSGGRIWNSNHPMLCGLVDEALGENGELLDLGTCGDEREELHRRLKRGLDTADMTIVSGGMSMGSKDLVPPVLKELGVEFHVEKVRMKPGKPFVFGTREVGGRRGYVAGLPGNPVSAFVTFQVFVRDILERLAGGRGGGRWAVARAAAPFPANGDREFFQPCTLERSGGGIAATALAWKGSGDVFTLARAQGLARRGINAPQLAAGESVEILTL